MIAAPDFETQQAFELVETGSQDVPFVLNSPHSGRVYPKRFLDMSQLDAHTIRRSEDHFVDDLFMPATALGIPMLKAHFPRCYLDVNREPYELDPRMFSDRLPAYVNRHSMRVAGGLGTVPRVVCEGVNIYGKRIEAREALQRIEAIYKPYHTILRGLLARTHRLFGHAVLVDCHSMPATVSVGPGAERPDFIIGNRFGTSASPALTETALATLRALGYHAVVNKPYAGGFITEHYGRPARGLHAIQIEINRGLYVDERTLRLKHGFTALQEDLVVLMRDLTRIPSEDLADIPLAAE